MLFEEDTGRFHGDGVELDDQVREEEYTRVEGLRLRLIEDMFGCWLWVC